MLLLTCGLAHMPAWGEGRCYNDMSEVLHCFINHEDNQFGYELQSQTKFPNGVLLKNYILQSQLWPIDPHPDIPQTIWQHKLSIFIPPNLAHNTALLHVANGYTMDKNGVASFINATESLRYAEIAQQKQAVVAALEDVPNQHLICNGKLSKEDALMACSYKAVMENPDENSYLNPHLPMAKSIVRAMDVIDDIIKQERNYNLKEYVLTGASKRGWATWLATLADERVKAMIPVVIDILNVEQNIKHICASYSFGCPPALRDYKELLPAKFDTVEFRQLMAVEDPFQYLGIEKYEQRLAVPKYIINAANDDFYTPDSSSFYFQNLPGNENYIRAIPNAMHYVMNNMLSHKLDKQDLLNQAIGDYFNFILHKTQLPKTQWVIEDNKITITSDVCPQKMQLWQAYNPKERDFRYVHSYDNMHLFYKKLLSYFSDNFGDTVYYPHKVEVICQPKQAMTINIPKQGKGWHSSFVEMDYDVDGNPFIITTEALVEEY